MKAVILAAGYATRLYPLTKDKPKPLLTVGDKPIIEHIIGKLEAVPEIDEIHVVTNDKFHKNFHDWSDHFQTKKKVVVHNDGTKSNDDRLGAVGDMHFAIDRAGIDDDVLVIGGDNLFEFEIDDMVSDFRKTGMSVVAARDLKDPAKLAKKFGVIETDSDGVIKTFEEKPEIPRSTLASTCIYLLNSASVSELKDLNKKGRLFDNTGDLVRHLSEKDSVKCYTFDSRWFDIGSHDQLKEAHEYMLGK